ncbi:SNARE associated Golgi protein [Musa troglodytarum]|uniref:SNARE associated Golgi protein n=1 Tax=Musa troglodytarum TaxID=320322 RepID=A0A9E7JMN7_9LILI|nr:SNARE associated Golgi protein [Musa troglodytarum]
MKSQGHNNSTNGNWAGNIWMVIVSITILMVCVTREAHASLEKALAENPVAENILIITSPPPPVPSESALHLQEPLMIKMEDTSNVDCMK